MDARVARVIGLMRQSRTDHFSMHDLSRNVNLSPTRLRQIFKRDTGRSPLQYVKALRIQRAEALLRNSFLSVKEVVFLSGLKDVSHFARDFKKKHGLTPSEFRSRSQFIEKANKPTDCRFG